MFPKRLRAGSQGHRQDRHDDHRNDFDQHDRRVYVLVLGVHDDVHRRLHISVPGGTDRWRGASVGGLYLRTGSIGDSVFRPRRVEHDPGDGRPLDRGGTSGLDLG